VEKREEAHKARVPLLGESGEMDEPSEAELIELITSGNVMADRVRIQDSQGQEYNLERTGELTR
jgi:hypothetical protein